MAIDEGLRRAAMAWHDDDPDPDTRAEVERLLADQDEAGLLERFSGELTFGTAGLRGLLGAGPNRMNRRVVARATAGLCAWVKAQVPDAAERGVCIGYDGRRLSRELAEDAAAFVAGAGLRARVFDHVVPTPVLAFAVKDCHAAAGIMVTASHNPPAYNGYKVYWENGAQIIPPHDTGIAAEIGRVERVADLPRLERSEATARGLLEVLGEPLERRYLDGVRALALHADGPRNVVVAYTALHGVGERFFRMAMADAGFTKVHSVAEQAEPDGRFPTVDFPNPEEKGAMDRVLALAAREGADLVLANDPDADRLAVAVRDADGRYVKLTGNEIGCLLAHYVLDQGDASGKRLVASSVVSSPMLGAIAAGHGVHWEQTLTGFKWIANRAMELERSEGYRFVFGYEEALGYTVGPLVRDKDGIGAAAVMADMASWCRSKGATLLDERETMWRRYGLYLSRQVAVTHPGQEGAAKIAAIMDGVRRDPPTAIAGHAVEAVADLETGRRVVRGGEPTTLPFPPSNVILLEIEGGHRVMLRPSGTEPKIKFYFDVRVAVGADETVSSAHGRGEALLESLVDSFGAHIA